MGGMRLGWDWAGGEGSVEADLGMHSEMIG